ncbi:hypothetical protein [Aurantiacibacter sp. MUD61]|uniref:hypothetical protein n=1 Tax=Aurantiacibacter sp. MUD61 TaxID=3009083 RepID=UPI0022F0DCFA|nr:hypothetical protein [Aurantiacibacter sp. MUD61]
MIRRFFGATLSLAAASALAACEGGAPEGRNSQSQHLIYLHGRIVEDGLPAVSERYGEYRFDDIVSTFRDEGFEVTAPLREADADPYAHADEISELVLEFLDRGVPPENITIIGASKGAFIASLVSDTMVGPQLRYVLLAGCSSGVNETFLSDGREFNGHVLSIRDSSDTRLAGTCAPVAEQSERLASFEEIVTETGLEHGLIFTPHEAWVQPSLDWANRPI